VGARDHDRLDSTRKGTGSSQLMGMLVPSNSAGRTWEIVQIEASCISAARLAAASCT
jgi:hypothetical protein